MSERAERLRAAIEARGLSKADFQRSISHLPGTSVPTAYRYIRGEADMTLSFVEAAASALNVSPGWLAFGDGEATGTSGFALRQVRTSLEKALDVVEGVLRLETPEGE